MGQVNKGCDPEGYSIPGQREATRAKASQLGASEVREYVEYGVSGRTTHRPALQKMMADLKQHRPAYVIIYDLSRLARNRLDDAQLMADIVSSGAELVSVLENIDQTPTGKLVHGIMASVHEYRSDGDALKVKMGMQRKHSVGGTNGKAPVGYLNIRKLELGRELRVVGIDPERGPLVCWAFATYATGEYSISALAEMLDAAGLRLPMTQKRPARPLTRSAVHRMLRDDYYIGIVTYDGKKADGQHAPLIEREIFERVQQILEARTRSGERSRKYEHYLKGSVYCGECGGRLVYTPVTGHGGRYEYFKCFSRHNLRTDCQTPHIRAAVVEVEVERWYEAYPWLTLEEKDRVRTEVRRYGQTKLTAAKREAEQAQRRLESLKREQQHLLRSAIAVS